MIYVFWCIDARSEANYTPNDFKNLRKYGDDSDIYNPSCDLRFLRIEIIF